MQVDVRLRPWIPLKSQMWKENLLPAPFKLKIFYLSAREMLLVPRVSLECLDGDREKEWSTNNLRRIA